MTSYRHTPDDYSVWQQAILAYQSAPPVSPTEGDRYIVKATGSGDWTGHDNAIAWYDGDSWVFVTPAEGFEARDIQAEIWRYFDGSAWQARLARNSGISEGTGADQSVNHGFISTPKRIELIPLEAGVTFSALTVDTTHFHVTVTSGKDWAWVAEMW